MAKSAPSSFFSHRRLGELAPPTVLRPDDLSRLGSDRVVAKRRSGARGGG